MPSVCTSRLVLWTMKWRLRPRVALIGLWTPRNPSAPLALSTRPPYSEWTLLLNDLTTWAWSHYSSFPSCSVPSTLTLSLSVGWNPGLPCFSHDPRGDSSSNNSYHSPLFILDAKPPLDCKCNSSLLPVSPTSSLQLTFTVLLSVDLVCFLNSVYNTHSFPVNILLFTRGDELCFSLVLFLPC